ncbi:hypothetical protein [uncultured Lacinutrix sp.]|uniref:hypothetical protein n=1 Tax=uncultured Lacinutrix sp. TaxID=574032 RepID=UPI00260FEC63|nr:hypothetical protein [uncultured Lacinutrix sp.]
MKNIRTSKVSKVIACYLALQLILTTIQPFSLHALTSGPSQPEFNSFTPIGTSDMVNLSSGDFNYNIPIMDVGGYPLNLAYDSGITMDQEASWVGLGWNLNVGQINRQVRGIPDDFNGDKMSYENNIKDNKTVGATVQFHPAAIGFDFGSALSLSSGFGVDYNNYTGWSYSSTNGASFKISDNITVGMNMSNSSTNGATISPSLSLASNKFGDDKYSLGGSIGTSFNSRQGLTSLTISPSLNKSFEKGGTKKDKTKVTGEVNQSYGGLGTGTKSFGTTSFTPTKRSAYVNRNSAANAAIGFEIFGGEGQGEVYIYGSEQAMANEERYKQEKAFGFNFTDNASKHDILDFNRENDRIISKHINALPVTNYTYDLYSINGQGISGMYQPYRSQVGYVYDKHVKDISKDNHLGIEIGPGGYVHIGIEFKSSPSNSSTGLWEDGNNARTNFIQSNNNNVDYEKVYYKSIGELNVDNEINLLSNVLGGEEPIKLGLTGSNLNKKTIADKYYFGTNEALNTGQNFPSNNKINRTKRLLRNQTIKTVSKKESDIFYKNYDNAPKVYNDAKDHHNVETRILQPDGSTYVFGQPVYNTKKQEVTFNASGRNYINNGNIDSSSELINYYGSDNSSNNGRGQDNYFNRVTTPAYVHTYLISEVLSSDYQDLTGNGPSDDDLGAYTKFHYDDAVNYNWRVPFQANSATSNKGLNSLENDDMGNYIYGEKEQIYINKIETKTHVAVFNLTDRNDGYGVIGHNGGLSQDSKMKKINTISLYSKPEYEKYQTELEDNDPDNDPTINQLSPIKVAHFEYDYSLCKNVPNNDPNDDDLDFNEDDFDGDLGGKLTLKSIYFTYRNSNMGKYTPYIFNYSDHNPNYHIKGYDMWGNYKDPSQTGLNFGDEPTTSEFPYVDQSDRVAQDINASAWTMNSINLPSGGKIQLDYEADDYAWVQNKQTMQMFKVRGVGYHGNPLDPNDSILTNDLLYNGDIAANYLYVELPGKFEEYTNGTFTTGEQFQEKYLSNIKNKPIFFKFLLNMVVSDIQKSDFVSGYCKIDTELLSNSKVFSNNSKVYASIPIKKVHLNKSEYDSSGENPMSKAGWYYGRQHINRIVYGQEEEENFDVLELAEIIVNQIGAMFSLFQGPNRELRNNYCAQKFSNSKSWVRLQCPDSLKIGGGARVSKIQMFDKWDEMTGNTGSDSNLYAMSYGQEYDYTLDGENTTSGVAAYEPFGGNENPFIEPFYDDVNSDKILAPEEQNYIEKPFGASFFPSPTVTYSKVTVSNLKRGAYNNLEIGKNGTGKVVNEFYTTKNFPTITKHTVLGDPNEVNYPSTGVSIIQSMFGLNFVTKKRLSMSQGFTVITNDMNGKPKSQKVYSESATSSDPAISGVDYIYNENGNGELINEVNTINENGEVETNTIGVDYSVVNDFRQSKSTSTTYGGDINLAVVPVLGFPVPLASGTPQFALHDNELRTASTTKVIHKTSFLVEKKAFDLGAEVSTVNKAWDAETGQVILTETSNEYNDKYYNLSYPAYWGYKGMGSASKNINLRSLVSQSGSNPNKYILDNGINASLFLHDGDEVVINDDYSDTNNDGNNKGWVTEVDNNTFSIINKSGIYITGVNEIKVIRSGYKNLQSGTMASITLMNNPIESTAGNLQDITATSLQASTWDAQRIVNASAVKYDDLWAAECDCDLPKIEQYDGNGNPIFDYLSGKGFNPYLYNIKGNWRAKESYAYLTGRYNGDNEYNPRNSGFFKNFDAFYKPDGTGNWPISSTKWTSASQVTKYSAYGAELENKDALNRYSAAQYDYNNKFPVAVASNSQYKEMGYNGFEGDINLNRSCLISIFSGPPTNPYGSVYNDSHFQFNGSLPSGFNSSVGTHVSNDEAHTGNFSLKLTPKNNNPDDGSHDSYLHKIISYNNYETSFSPEFGEKYFFSAWVKVNDTQNSQPLTYEDVYAKVQLVNSSGVVIISSSFLPKGDIIGGWQRITGVIDIPNNSSTISIGLINDNIDKTAYVDDVRMHPYNSSMKSFVYDQENYRLMAELDDNNYATFYEYDNEGGLVRVKKETEKGIMTIQETRSGNKISN